MGPNGTLRYADLSAVEHGGYSLQGASPMVVPQKVIDPDADGSEPVLDQDSTLGAWAPPVSKVPYVARCARWTSTHTPSDAAATKWQACAQRRCVTEVHMPDSWFVPMEGQPSGNVRRDADITPSGAPRE